MALLKETSRQVNIVTNNERATGTVRKQKSGLVTLEAALSVMTIEASHVRG